LLVGFDKPNGVYLLASKKTVMRKYVFLLIILSVSWLFVFAQTSSQTKQAAFLNNLNNFQQVFGDLNYPRARVQDVAADDNIYTCSAKMPAIKDSTKPSGSNTRSTLALQGFGFAIPDDATIENIVIKVRRFKKGNPPVGDHILSLMQRFQQSPGLPGAYGAMWSFLDDEELDYPGRIYPATETEYLFSQSGSGNNGGGFHDQAYEWTPAIINAVTFGVLILSYPAVGKGSVQVCYDLVEVTVEYSIPEAGTRKSPEVAETKPLKAPIVYPNPFTTKSNIQFTAAETGSAVVELYNITGTKIRTLYSANVIQGQTYNVTTGDAQLPKGVYVYMIKTGKQKLTGRIMKLE